MLRRQKAGHKPCEMKLNEKAQIHDHLNVAVSSLAHQEIVLQNF